MIIILDTNVVSESFRSKPDAGVRAWINSQVHTDLYLCAPVIAEIRYGIARLSQGAHRDRLTSLADKFQYDLYRGRIFPLDDNAASIYGNITAERHRKGRSISPMDGLIAAITIANGAAIATRDSYGFADLGLTIIDPFQVQL